MRRESSSVGHRPVDLPDGTALSLRQHPAVLTPDHRGPVHLRAFEVMGAATAVTFAFRGDATRTATFPWVRSHERHPHGHTVRDFDVTLPGAWLNDALRVSRVGFDKPFLHIADYNGPGHPVPIYLRFAPPADPADKVRLDRNGYRAQMTSHVVNLVDADFGDHRIKEVDLMQLDIERIARAFYALRFGDDYHVLAIYPSEIHAPGFGGFHQVVARKSRASAPWRPNARTRATASRGSAARPRSGGSSTTPARTV